MPHDGYFNDKQQQFGEAVGARLSWINDLKTMFSTMEMSDTTGGIADIHANIPVVGQDEKIVDFSYLNAHASFIRGLCSAFIYILLAIYLARELPKVLGYMS